MNKHVIIFEFKTFFDEKMEDHVMELNFIPYKGLNIFISDEFIKLPKKMENRGWFEVAEVDYLMADNAFVVSLKEIGGYTENE
jgi:hypothetical protein